MHDALVDQNIAGLNAVVRYPVLNFFEDRYHVKIPPGICLCLCAEPVNASPGAKPADPFRSDQIMQPQRKSHPAHAVGPGLPLCPRLLKGRGTSMGTGIVICPGNARRNIGVHLLGDLIQVQDKPPDPGHRLACFTGRSVRHDGAGLIPLLCQDRHPAGILFLPDPFCDLYRSHIPETDLFGSGAFLPGDLRDLLV